MKRDLELADFIRDVPDFPKPGILFKDITPLLANARAFAQTIELLAEPFAASGLTHIAGIESRGFIFGAALARRLDCGFVPIRKPMKLPWTTHRHEYDLEYGSDALEVHDDAIKSTERVLIVDDVLATGGTASAARALMDLFGASVEGIAVVIELEFLGGRNKLHGANVHSLLRY